MSFSSISALSLTHPTNLGKNSILHLTLVLSTCFFSAGRWGMQGESMEKKTWCEVFGGWVRIKIKNNRKSSGLKLFWVGCGGKVLSFFFVFSFFFGGRNDLKNRDVS